MDGIPHLDAAGQRRRLTDDADPCAGSIFFRGKGSAIDHDGIIAGKAIHGLQCLGSQNREVVQLFLVCFNRLRPQRILLQQLLHGCIQARHARMPFVRESSDRNAITRDTVIPVHIQIADESVFVLDQMGKLRISPGNTEPLNHMKPGMELALGARPADVAKSPAAAHRIIDAAENIFLTDLKGIHGQVCLPDIGVEIKVNTDLSVIFGVALRFEEQIIRVGADDLVHLYHGGTAHLMHHLTASDLRAVVGGFLSGNAHLPQGGIHDRSSKDHLVIAIIYKSLIIAEIRVCLANRAPIHQMDLDGQLRNIRARQCPQVNRFNCIQCRKLIDLLLLQPPLAGLHSNRRMLPVDDAEQAIRRVE